MERLREKGKYTHQNDVIGMQKTSLRVYLEYSVLIRNISDRRNHEVVKALSG